MRADVYIYTSGHTKSRQEAKGLIEKGVVTVDGRTVEKPSEEIDNSGAHEVCVLRGEKFVSRGGLKLEAALSAFGINVSGMDAVDIGASTGGFTDCLLQRGAAHVTALDAGCGQLDKKLLSDSRVTSIEKFNARRLAEDDDTGISGRFGIAVMDVSFISQTYIIPGLPKILDMGGYFVSLIKPQFEAGRGAVGRGGIVKDAKYHIEAIKRVSRCAAAAGFGCIGVIKSPILGGDGNTEYLAAWKLGEVVRAPSDEELKKIIGSGRGR